MDIGTIDRSDSEVVLKHASGSTFSGSSLATLPQCEHNKIQDEDVRASHQT